MRRSTVLRLVLLACAPLGTVAVPAAPAPVYKPKSSTPWVTGWDKPVDALGDCRFTKAGDKLTITVPRAGHELGNEGGRNSAPLLLREVDGDFDIRVRVMGDFSRADPNKGEARRGAGIVLTDGTSFVWFGRSGDQGNALTLTLSAQRMSGVTSISDVNRRFKPVLVRIERRKNLLTVKYRTDGPQWVEPFDTAKGHSPIAITLPKKLKVGVFAESMAPGTFAPVFDHFELTPAK